MPELIIRRFFIFGAYTFPSVALLFPVTYFFINRASKTSFSNARIGAGLAITWLICLMPGFLLGPRFQKAFPMGMLVLPILMTVIVVYALRVNQSQSQGKEHMMGKLSLSTAAIFIGVVVLGISGTLGRNAARPLRMSEPDARSLATLTKVASQMNKNLPASVNRDTELTNVAGLEGTIVYNYRLVNATSAELDAKKLMRQTRPGVMLNVCSLPETRDDFLQKGVTMRYTYSDKNREYVGSFDINLSDCGSQTNK